MDSGVAVLGFTWLFVLVLFVLVIAGMWKTFEKAGRPGWAAIVPIYNTVVLLQVAGRPSWWVILYFVPILSFVITIIVALDTARAFGKSSFFGLVALWLFSGIGYMILGFGSDKYLEKSFTPQIPTQ